MNRSPLTVSRRCVLAAVLVLVLVVSGVAAKIVMTGGAVAEPSPLAETSRAPPGLPLTPVPARLDFGPVPAGGRSTLNFELVNRSRQRVEIGPVTTSCDCFRVELAETSVPAGARVRATAVLDLSHDPTFRGRLGLGARVAVVGSPAITLHLTIDVAVE